MAARAESISHSFASLTRERYFHHSKIKFVSPCGHVISSIYNNDETIFFLFIVNLVLIRSLATCMQVRTCVPEKCRRKENKLIEKQMEESEQYMYTSLQKWWNFLRVSVLTSAIMYQQSVQCFHRLNCSLPEDHKR